MNELAIEGMIVSIEEKIEIEVRTEVLQQRLGEELLCVFRNYFYQLEPNGYKFDAKNDVTYDGYIETTSKDELLEVILKDSTQRKDYKLVYDFLERIFDVDKDVLRYDLISDKVNDQMTKEAFDKHDNVNGVFMQQFMD